jgi:hypothetical protein
MNNDLDYEMVKFALKKAGITWPQAQMDSIRNIEIRYRIHLFPTTLLLDPEGKIVSLGQTRRKQPALRGRNSFGLSMTCCRRKRRECRTN